MREEKKEQNKKKGMERKYWQRNFDLFSFMRCIFPFLSNRNVSDFDERSDLKLLGIVIADSSQYV